MKNLLFLILPCIFLTACQLDHPVRPVPVAKGVLFLGHTYQWHGVPNRVDFRLEKIDFRQYEQIWLGGDICVETTQDPNTVKYLDHLFDLSDPNHHWAVGNHDIRNGNLDLISGITDRPLFYTHHDRGMTVMVLNTNLTPDRDCELLDRQSEMIRKVCDTIAASSHLVILSHHAIWGQVESAEMELWNHTNADRHYWASSCSQSVGSQFHRRIYPHLVEVQERGVQVVFISGDFGIKSKAFEHRTQEGLWFLGCGINNSFYKDPIEREMQPDDKLLYLEYDAKNSKLEWEFLSLESLIK